VYRVVIEYEEEAPARAAFATALRLTLAAMHDEPFDAGGGDRSAALAGRRAPAGAEHRGDRARGARRGIPVIRLTETGSLIQLGYGKHQKRIIASETTNTSAIAVELCHEKPLTNGILRSVGVPVPEGRTVRTADEACTPRGRSDCPSC
jgi:cyanophycin synthetase